MGREKKDQKEGGGKGRKGEGEGEKEEEEEERKQALEDLIMVYYITANIRMYRALQDHREEITNPF